MATKSLFRYDIASEQNLYEELIIESVQIYGTDVYYIPRESMGHDQILNDDIISEYKDAYQIEMYIENTEGFDGDGDLFTKFGIEIRDAVTFIVSKRRWNDVIASYRDDAAWWRPREGDIIYIPLTESTFQIMKTEEKTPFFQIGKLNVFKMSCELYDYSGENFNTGIPEIDRVETFAYQYQVTLSDSADGYIFGENVTQTFSSGVVMRGEIINIEADSNTRLFIAHSGANDGKYHDFIPGLPIVGSQSGQSWNVLDVIQLQKIEASSQGDIFKEAASTILDFSEDNPFGNPLQ